MIDALVTPKYPKGHRQRCTQANTKGQNGKDTEVGDAATLVTATDSKENSRDTARGLPWWSSG